MRKAAIAVLLAAACCLAAQAQTAPRVKGRIMDFDGLTFHLAPEMGGAPMTVRMQADTIVTAVEKIALSDIRIGAYAAVTFRDRDGDLSAEEVRLMPEALRGSGEGRLALGGGRFAVSGAVTTVDAHSITLFYRGARQVAGICLDRVDPIQPVPACTGTPHITVPPDAAVTTLRLGDRRLLVPGAVATVSLASDGRGGQSTPGLTLEKP